MKSSATVLVFVLGSAVSAGAALGGSAYPAMAPVARYRMAGAPEEIALARSAAPGAISAGAEILTLGARGYETAVKGSNGFVCLVERAWGAGYGDSQFWNPKIRGPICYNPAGARSVLPAYLKRTGWVLAGASLPDLIDRSKLDAAANGSAVPEAGAMGFMMSKQEYLGDGAGHWHPHLMFFQAQVANADWGANLQGSPIKSDKGEPDAFTTFFVAVPSWSDGTPAPIQPHP